MLGRKISIKVNHTDFFAIAVPAVRRQDVLRSFVRLRSLGRFSDLIQHLKRCVAGGFGFRKSTKW